MGCGASHSKYNKDGGKVEAVDTAVPSTNVEVENIPSTPCPGAAFRDGLGEAPVTREQTMQTLITLVAAAAMARFAPGGVVQVVSTSPLQDGAIAFVVTDPSAEGAESDLKADVEAIIADGASLELETMSAVDAHMYLTEYEVSAALLDSLTAPTVVMYRLELGNGSIFRTPAVAPLAPIASLKNVAWDIRANYEAIPSNFLLVGPSHSDLSELGSESAGFLVPQADQMSLAIANCEAKAANRLRAQKAQESRHEDTFSTLAAELGDHRFIVVSGPSSSGKTTFTHRLCHQLRSLGRESHVMELDDYFRARSDPEHPRDAHGELDFEHPGALRLEKLRDDLATLKAGERVELPRFDFKTGEYDDHSGHFLELEETGVLMMEGILGLHPIFQEALEVPCFKILVGPYSGLKVDNLYIVPEKLMRVMRRIGRDTAHRGVSAARVLHKVDSVARGEQSNIFPFAASADFVFDTALGYEVSALQHSLLAELRKTPPTESAVVLARSRELQGILSWVEPWRQLQVPKASILSEFIAESMLVDSLE